MEQVNLGPKVHILDWPLVWRGGSSQLARVGNMKFLKRHRFGVFARCCPPRGGKRNGPPYGSPRTHTYTQAQTGWVRAGRTRRMLNRARAEPRRDAGCFLPGIGLFRALSGPFFGPVLSVPCTVPYIPTAVVPPSHFRRSLCELRVSFVYFS